MDSILPDLRLAVRSLRRRPSFTVVVVLTIAIGMGAATAMFSLVNAALVRPLPFREPGRLVYTWGVAGPERDQRAASYPEVRDWRASNRTLSALATYDDIALTLGADGGEASRLEAEIVSADFFSVLGVAPARGRAFLPEEDRTPNSHPVAIISDRLWTTRFASDPRILGRVISLNGRPFTVVGVMAPGFRGLSFDTDVWIPSMMIGVVRSTSALADRSSRFLGGIGRLRAGVSVDDAQRDLSGVAARLATAYPETNADRGVQLFSLEEYYLGTTRTLLLALFGAVGLLLAIACANVASLLLVRASGRRRETSLRVALGAGRARIVRQFVAEGIVLALAGAAVGGLLAMWGIDGLLPFVPEGVLPAYVDVHVDWRVIVFSTLIALVCGVGFGLAPALARTPGALAQTLKQGAPSTAAGLGSLRRVRAQQALVIGEVALALVLLIGAALMVRSFRYQLAVDPGFQSDGLLALRVALPRDTYVVARRAAMAEQIVQRLSALPEVRSAAVAGDLPLRGLESSGFMLYGDENRDVRFARHLVTPDFFATLSIPLVRGRAFTPDDRAGTPLVAMVSATTARRLWPGKDPTAQRIRIDLPDGPWVQIVGVVGDVRFRDLTTDLATATNTVDVYFPFAQSADDVLEVVVRTRADANTLAARIRSEIARLDATLPVFEVATLDRALAAQMATARFASLLLSVFAGVALLLAAVGIYGLLAFVVGSSRRDIAIRIALGASNRAVIGLVIRKGMAMAFVGVWLGIAGAAIGTRAIENVLFGVRSTDVATYAAVAGILLVVVLIACWLPARRASRVAPQLALKSE
jgi:putative ABC transport system permease protein